MRYKERGVKKKEYQKKKNKQEIEDERNIRKRNRKKGEIIFEECEKRGK